MTLPICEPFTVGHGEDLHERRWYRSFGWPRHKVFGVRQNMAAVLRIYGGLGEDRAEGSFANNVGRGRSKT